MNIALEKTEEYVNGVKRRSYGDAFVRGNNGELPPSAWLEFALSKLMGNSHVYFGRLNSLPGISLASLDPGGDEGTPVCVCVCVLAK